MANIVGHGMLFGIVHKRRHILKSLLYSQHTRALIFQNGYSRYSAYHGAYAYLATPSAGDRGPSSDGLGLREAAFDRYW